MSKYNKIDKLQNDLNSIGSTVKKIMIDVVNDKHINESIRNKIVEKIGKIHFKAVDCGPSNSRPEFAVSNWTEIYAYYEQYLEEVHICNGYYLFQNSVPSLLFTMSHELAHSFDPNQSAIQIKKKRSFSTSAYNYILTNGYINYSSGAMTDSHIAASEYFLPEVISCLMNHEGLNNDAIFSEKRSSIYSEIKMPFLKSHLPEAFSDLIASEVLGRYINELHPGLTPKEGRFAIINALRFACEVDHLSSRLDATHPSLQNRLEKVVLSNPRIRKLLECTKENINPPNCWDRKYIPYLK